MKSKLALGDNFSRSTGLPAAIGQNTQWPSVAIIILTWNQCNLTMNCLNSLTKLDYPTDQLHIIVVDNASTDDTVNSIHNYFPAVTVLENNENLGYAGGNNVGIRHAIAQGTDFICILNNDIIVAPDFLISLITVLQQHPDVGIITPLVAEMMNPDRVWSLGMQVDRQTGSVFRLHADEAVALLQAKAPVEIDVASGAAMLVKREVFERAGFLDEKFYLYFEEADWCLRARRAGYRILATPSTVVWHKVSATLGPTSPVIDYYMARNQLRFIARHWSYAACLILTIRLLLRTFLTIAAYTVKPHNGARLPHRNARLLALRDGLLGRWGKMGPDVEAACFLKRI